MTVTILDCYTDEPAGLGVPPYLGTYPRYVFGKIVEETGELPTYLTIDDLRAHIFYQDKFHEKKTTDIRVYNLTKNYPKIQQILDGTTELIIILGVHVPGKYLSALPGTLHEVISLVKHLKCRKVLTGPAIIGTSLEGGKTYEKADLSHFDEIRPFQFPFPKVASYSLLGARIVEQIPDYRIVEIESGRGCTSKGCNFCTEPIKSRLMFRKREDIVRETEALFAAGVRDVRLGKQSCFYDLPSPDKLVEEINHDFKWRTFHIDNVIPNNVLTPRCIKTTEAIVKYCTPGNIAAFGVESFDPAVVEANQLNCSPEDAYRAVAEVNRLGKELGGNGMPKYLPGINVIFGLEGESKATHEHNMRWLRKILDDGLLVRRINVRQVVVFEGTRLQERAGLKYLKKNKKYYWKWRDEIRHKVDLPMLGNLVPKGHILRNVRTEIYDGNTTFGRQIGSYPLVVGVKGHLPLKEFVDIRVTGHMLRSVTGEVFK